MNRSMAIAAMAALALCMGCSSPEGRVIDKTHVPAHWVTATICDANGVCTPVVSLIPECWRLNTSGGSTCVPKQIYDETSVGSYYTSKDE